MLNHEIPQRENISPDRKLGEEWTDWDGKLHHADTQAPAGIFLGLAGLAIAGYILAGGIAAWLILPRLAAMGLERLLFWAVGVWFGYLVIWYLALVMAALGIKPLRRLVRWLGGIRWMVNPSIQLARIWGVSRDQVGHAFVLLHNRLEVMPSRVKDPARLLVLTPRCLGRENMQGLRALKEKYGFSQITVLGGTEARKAIDEYNPRGIVAMACERDLLVGINDLKGRIPVLAFSNQRPEGPCKNTVVDLQAIENAVKVFLGV